MNILDRALRRPCSHRVFSPTSRRHYSVSFSVATCDSQSVVNPRQEQMSANELFAQTSGRWLWNDDIHQRLRFKHFNANVLGDVVCQSLNAQSCLSWKKIGEGSFNKVFLLEFDNGRQAALRIPNPLVPNQDLSIASEVATMEYVRERFATDEMVPKPPKVFAWDASPHNATGTAYILLEYLEGVPLSSRWYDIQGKPVVSALLSLLRLERSLLVEPFSQHGSIYFADTNEVLKSRTLYRSEEYQSRYPTLAEKYRIGPAVTREWWRDCYGAVQANRGPWPDMPTMIRSAAELQLQVLADGVGLKNPYVRTTSTDVPELCRLLKMCISIANVVVPSTPIYSQPSFNHPDLTLNNLLVHPDGDDLTIQGLIDWQGACVAPYCAVVGLPTAVVYNGGLINNRGEFGKDPPFPEGFDSLPHDEQEVIRVHHRLAVRQQVYSELIVQLQPSRYKTWRLPHADSLSNLVGLTLRSISDGPQALRETLLDVKEQWDEIIALSGNGADIPCPIDLSLEEMEVIRRTKEGRLLYDHNKCMVCGDIGCGPDGWVHLADFEEAKKKLQKWKRHWNDEDMGGPFPFYDGAWWYNLT